MKHVVSASSEKQMSTAEANYPLYHTASRVTQPSSRPSIAEPIPPSDCGTEASPVPNAAPRDSLAGLPGPGLIDPPIHELSESIRAISRLVCKASYVILFVALALTIGCAFPASDLNSHVSQDTLPPDGSQAANARAFFKQYFPTQAAATGFVIFSNAVDLTVDLGTDPRYLMYDKAVEYYCMTGSLNFNRSSVPALPPKAATKVSAYSSFRAVLVAGLPEPVALSYLAPGNRSAMMTVAYSDPYVTQDTKDFDVGLQAALLSLASDYNISTLVENTLFSLPTFLAAISNSSSGDMETLLFIVFPLSLAVFAIAVSSARLLLPCLAAIGVSYCVSFAILDGVARQTPINSMAPSICLFLLLSYTLTYSFYFMSQYRKRLLATKQEFEAGITDHRTAEALVGFLYTTSGRSVAISCVAVCFSGIGLTLFQTDLLRSLGIATIIVIIVTMMSCLLVVPACIAAFPNFFSHSADPWINAIHPDNLAEETAQASEVVQPLTTGEMSIDASSPLYERVHLMIIKFVAESPQRFLFAVFCIALCSAPIVFAFGGATSTNLNQYMPQSTLLDRWGQIQQAFRAGDVFSYNILMLGPNEDLDDAFFTTTQQIIYSMSEQLPLTYIRDFDGISIDGTQSGYLPNGGNITSNALGYCFSHYSEPECKYRLLVTFYIFRSGAATYFMFRPRFDPVSQEGMDWYKQAVALLPKLEAQYGYKLYIYGYGADSYDTVEYANSVLGKIAGVTVAAVFLCLALAFGSLIIPLKVVFSTFLAVGSAYGIVNLVYDHDILGFLKVSSLSGQSHSVAWQAPLVCLTICTGIVLNFEIIVLVRVFDQRWHGIDSHVAVVRGFASVGREVSVAAFMSLINFGGLLANSIPAINQVGLYFFAATLVQAFLLRLFLTPALMSVAGQWNWWPMQFLVSRCTPFALEDEVNEFRPTLDDRKDFRMSMSRNARHTVMVDLASAIRKEQEIIESEERRKHFEEVKQPQRPKSLAVVPSGGAYGTL